MAKFKPFEMDSIPIEEQFMNWDEIVPQPYDKKKVDTYSRSRGILMNGIENNAVLMSHVMEKMIKDPEIKREMGLMRRADSMQQQFINWVNPADQTILETTIGYEQVAVDLTANLAKNEPDDYVKSALDFALLEDFDHLFRFGVMLETLENGDPEMITQGNTEVKPGRPTLLHHRHNDDLMRKHYDKDEVSIKTVLNYHTITSGEQQTMLFYKDHGFMYEDELTRKLYSEIADVEQEHVTQYGQLADPQETMLEKMTTMELAEAYNYFSCAQTESDPRMKKVWEKFTKMEIEHFNKCAELLKKHEGTDAEDLIKEDTIKDLVVFEPNKKYVNKVLEEQIDMLPNKMEFVRLKDLPDDWSSFMFQRTVNSATIPSEKVVKDSKSDLSKKEEKDIYQDVKKQMQDRL